MKRFLFLVMLAAVEVGHAEFVTDLSKGWRFSVGPQFNFNASGRLGVKGGAIPLPAASFSSTRGAAKAAGDRISEGSWPLTLPNGAFVNPNDAAGIPGETWNWYVPAGQMRNGSMSFANAYSEHSTVYEAVGGSDKDSNWSVGTSFGIDRAIWTYGDFGVDVGFNFAFFLKDDWFKGSAGGYRRTDSVIEGEYLTDVNFNPDVVNDPWAQNPDGSWGVGTYEGPGPILDLNNGDVAVSHRWGAESSRSTTSFSGPFSIRGNLQMYEFQLALKPYYELTEWFMVRGTLGVGLDYRNFDVKVSGLGGETVDDWDCYMVYGLGGMFHWKGICFGADFLGKVFDDDLDVDTKYVNGSIGNAKWGFRAYVGYEF